ncbi:Uncharacterised protein [uncultured archaeon]|nr:Uncharacterised protein [uncultured archaeon]
MVYGMKEYDYKITLSSVEKRVKYLEGLVTDANNRLVNDSELSPMDRSRLYSIIVEATRTIHSMEKDTELEDVEKKLEELEDAYAKTG